MAKNKVILCDTNIIIELSKNNLLISQELQAIGSANIAVSAVSAGELMYGALNKAELAKIKKGLNAIQIIHLDETISGKCLELLEDYSLSHNLDVPDALIAATAITQNLPLYTLNLKDFRFIEGIKLYLNK